MSTGDKFKPGLFFSPKNVTSNALDTQAASMRSSQATKLFKRVQRRSLHLLLLNLFFFHITLLGKWGQSAI